MSWEIAVQVYRGDVIEAQHCATVAVVDAEGKLTHYLGDPEMIYMTRSAVKPFQALPLVRTGGFDQFKFTPEHLAVMCASHNGNDKHREVVLSALQQAGNRPEDLQCGTHLPIHMRLKGLRPEHGEDKDPLRHNCSGKHAGFLALARYMGVPDADYINPQSKSQQLVKEAVGEICEFPAEQISVGVDGCSAPVFSMRVRNLAVGFKNLAIPQSKDARTRQALRRIKEAMTTHPFLVAGEGRFDYDFMRSFPGNGVSKVGAEAIQGMGFSDPPIGICVKIRDGGTRALGPVCVEVLKQLGIIDNVVAYPYLKDYVGPTIRNYRDIVCGRIVVDFQLKKV